MSLFSTSVDSLLLSFISVKDIYVDNLSFIIIVKLQGRLL
jgi:hypothetical protein